MDLVSDQGTNYYSHIRPVYYGIISNIIKISGVMAITAKLLIQLMTVSEFYLIEQQSSCTAANRVNSRTFKK